MGKLRAWAMALAVSGLAATAAFAQDSADHDARLILARQIIALRSDEASEMTTFRAKLPYFTASIEAAMHLSDAERSALPDMLEAAYRAVRTPVHEHVAATYARIFTLAQLQQIQAFYQSDAGQAYLTHQQELTSEGISLQRLGDAAVIASVTHNLEDARRGAPR